MYVFWRNGVARFTSSLLCEPRSHKSGLIRAWSTTTWQCELELQGHQDSVTAVAAWGSCLVSGSADGSARLWNLSGE